MSKSTKIIVPVLVVAIIAVFGYALLRGPAKPGPEKAGPEKPGPKEAAAPVFSLAWSEYPSWSTFGVAHEFKLIDGHAGAMGPIEKKWGVDIELKEADYDSCIQMYGAAKCDAACLTNMDVLNPSLRRPSVAIMPTSTSYGADALIVPDTITDIKQLRGKNVYGLAKSVSEYCFARNLEILGEDEKDYKFTNMDPGAAALAFLQRKKGYEAIKVWHPFVIEVLSKRKDATRLFDSTKIPGEIIDMVQVAQTSLDRPGGKAFAFAVMDAFYMVNRLIADPRSHDAAVKALAEKFAKLDQKSMEQVLTECRFFATPERALPLLKGEKFRLYAGPNDAEGMPTAQDFKAIMERVAKFCVSHDIVPRPPTIGYGDKDAAPNVDFRLDPTYVQEFQAKSRAK